MLLLGRKRISAYRVLGQDSAPPQSWAIKIGGTTLRSIGHVAKLQTIDDNNDSFVPARDMLRELMNDNKKIAASKPALLCCRALRNDECDRVLRK